MERMTAEELARAKATGEKLGNVTILRLVEQADALRNYSKNSSGSPTAPAGFDERESFIWSLGYMAGKDSPAPALPVVPQGMALVPVEPTRPMLNAIWGKSSQLDLPDAYAAMLAAAPVLSAEQPSQPQDQSGIIRPSAEPAGQHDASIATLERVKRWVNKFPVPTSGATGIMLLLRDVQEALLAEQTRIAGAAKGGSTKPESSPIAEPDTATQAAKPLTDDEIYNAWLYRDCIDAIRAGDVRAQFISAVRSIESHIRNGL